jgi:hypothetical protein
MEKGLNINVISIDEGDDTVHYNLIISNGETSTAIDFYGYADFFMEFAEKLSEFPKTIKDRVYHQIGKDVKKWAYFILMEVYCYGQDGSSTMKVVVDNHGEAPYYQRCEFYLIAEPASFNRLGEDLKKWNPVEQPSFEWIVKL